MNILRAADVTPNAETTFYEVHSWEAYWALMARLEELEYKWLEGQRPTQYKTTNDLPVTIQVRGVKIAIRNNYDYAPNYRIVL